MASLNHEYVLDRRYRESVLRFLAVVERPAGGTAGLMLVFDERTGEGAGPGKWNAVWVERGRVNG
ncbi:hypothetical protein [Dactylosporangium sp. NPDC049140]|uniref:hypothetical protein n=1 Tax=Dactylosporangium sp. NPDC049140 TaxID=3155647 RepID=UPI0033D404BB